MLRRQNIPVINTLLGLGGFPADHPLSFGNGWNARNVHSKHGNL